MQMHGLPVQTYEKHPRCHNPMKASPALYIAHILAFIQEIRVRLLRTDLYCAVEFVSVTETSICRFCLLSRSRIDLLS